MSVPDRELNEPEDYEWCAEHCSYRPCKYCRFDCLMQRAEEAREERESNP